MGQEPTLCCVTEELSESPQPTDGEQEVNPASEITTERQRELATKVSTIGRVGIVSIPPGGEGSGSA